jgi:hypothetical protein
MILASRKPQPYARPGGFGLGGKILRLPDSSRLPIAGPAPAAIASKKWDICPSGKFGGRYVLAEKAKSTCAL